MPIFGPRSPSVGETSPSGDGGAGGRRERGARILVLFSVMVVVGVGAWWWREDDSWRQVRRAGVVRIGYAVEAPYALVTEAGRVTGESPEIARVVAGRLGLGEPEWVLTEFGSLIEELEAGRFDVIAAGMFVTPERARRVGFSRATFTVGPGLLVRRGNPAGLRGAVQLTAKPGPRVAVLSGSVEADFLGSGVGVPDAEAGLALVMAGRVDALLLSRPTVRWMAARDEAVESVESFAAPTELAGRVAFAFRREDRVLRAKWDEALAEIMRGDEYREIAGRFGFDATVGEGGL